MRILVACEESQRVTIELRKRGHEAYSCDIEECSGGHPEWHIHQDVLPLINGFCDFYTMDGSFHSINSKWDALICFPPCTYLSIAGNRWFNVEKYGDKAIQRQKNREDAVAFFLSFANADCDKIAIENPVGVMNTRYRKPNQIIQPYQFGHPESKKTCLWLKGLKNLEPTDIVEKPEDGWVNQYKDAQGRLLGFKTVDENGKVLSFSSKETQKIRSKTYPGIAKAMAEQWF